MNKKSKKTNASSRLNNSSQFQSNKTRPFNPNDIRVRSLGKIRRDAIEAKVNWKIQETHPGHHFHLPRIHYPHQTPNFRIQQTTLITTVNPWVILSNLIGWIVCPKMDSIIRIINKVEIIVSIPTHIQKVTQAKPETVPQYHQKSDITADFTNRSMMEDFYKPIKATHISQ